MSDPIFAWGNQYESVSEWARESGLRMDAAALRAKPEAAQPFREMADMFYAVEKASPDGPPSSHEAGVFTSLGREVHKILSVNRLENRILRCSEYVDKLVQVQRDHIALLKALGTKLGVNPTFKDVFEAAITPAKPEVVYESSFEAFIDKACAVDLRSEIQAAVLYEAYLSWCSREGEEIVSRTKFGREMAKREEFSRRKEGCIYWRKIRLL